MICNTACGAKMCQLFGCRQYPPEHHFARFLTPAVPSPSLPEPSGQCRPAAHLTEARVREIVREELAKVAKP